MILFYHKLSIVLLFEKAFISFSPKGAGTVPYSEQLELEETKRQLALYKQQDQLLAEIEQTLYKMKEIAQAAADLKDNPSEIKNLVLQMEAYEKSIHSMELKLVDLRRIAASPFN
ncbi:hypothetical protein QWT69_04340 [Sporosarcina oncorhynchi]|uniref:Uncharacterized protein n=1 Tax=Sporosarcina oncorhynchi TaxID=3056444 RepID=A0ABZ0L719_9BACL|nr:hypothetical protein [Sporosarcina sp. T2O-4]WOV88359.1 hypothetical protein QWT69_04340 [Sporosarcina sp. T2O-4]